MAKQRAGWGGRRKGAGRRAELADAVLRSISFERAQLDFLARASRAEGVSISEVVRRACAAYLKRRAIR